MPSRIRYRTRDEIFGTVFTTEPGGTVLINRTGEISAQTFFKECQDWYGKKRREDGSLPPSDLSITEEIIQPTIVDYSKTQLNNGVTTKVFAAIPLKSPNLKTSSPNGSWNTIEKSDDYYVAKLLAESNPFNYSVSVPIMVVELIEAASLLRLAQSNFLTLGGSAYLNYQFGYKTLMSDIKALHKITKTIEDKIVDFNRLVRKGGLRVKRFLGSDSWTKPSVTEHAAWSTFGETFYNDYVPTYTSKVWGTCRWRPKRLTEIEVAKLTSVNTAIRYALDLGALDPSTFWELIPFSWLVDYFVNVGDVLTALEKSDVVEPYDICIMRTRTIEASLPLYKSWWHNTVYQGSFYRVSHTPGKTRVTIKLRTVRPTPTGYLSLLSFGILTEAQAMNLTALLLTLSRFKK